jgi:hypothetical protein
MPLLALPDTEDDGDAVELAAVLELLTPAMLVVPAELTLELVALEPEPVCELTDVVSTAVDAGADVVAAAEVADELCAALLAAIDDDSETALEQTDPGPWFARNATMMFSPVRPWLAQAVLTLGTMLYSALIQAALQPAPAKSDAEQPDMSAVYTLSHADGKFLTCGGKSESETAIADAGSARIAKYLEGRMICPDELLKCRSNSTDGCAVFATVSRACGAAGLFDGGKWYALVMRLVLREVMTVITSTPPPRRATAVRRRHGLMPLVFSTLSCCRPCCHPRPPSCSLLPPCFTAVVPGGQSSRRPGDYIT